jgi:hypothetical protein
MGVSRVAKPSIKQKKYLKEKKEMLSILAQLN